MAEANRYAEEMLRMQNDAQRRVQEMERRARAAAREMQPEAPPAKEPPPPVSPKSPPAPQTLSADEAERMTILCICLLLSAEGADEALLVALLYLLT